jgi:hypothetical protein
MGRTLVGVKVVTSVTLQVVTSVMRVGVTTRIKTQRVEIKKILAQKVRRAFHGVMTGHAVTARIGSKHLRFQACAGVTR